MERYLNLRYDGTDVPVMTSFAADGTADPAKAFEEQYKREFGFVLEVSLATLGAHACLERASACADWDGEGLVPECKDLLSRALHNVDAASKACRCYGIARVLQRLSSSTCVES